MPKRYPDGEKVSGEADRFYTMATNRLRNVHKAVMGESLGGHTPMGCTVSLRGKGDVLVVFRRRNGKTGIDEVHFESVYNLEGLLDVLNSAWDKPTWKTDPYSKRNKGED